MARIKHVPCFEVRVDNHPGTDFLIARVKANGVAATLPTLEASVNVIGSYAMHSGDKGFVMLVNSLPLAIDQAAGCADLIILEPHSGRDLARFSNYYWKDLVSYLRSSNGKTTGDPFVLLVPAGSPIKNKIYGSTQRRYCRVSVTNDESGVVSDSIAQLPLVPEQSKFANRVFRMKSLFLAVVYFVFALTILGVDLASAVDTGLLLLFGAIVLGIGFKLAKIASGKTPKAILKKIRPTM